MTYWLPFQRMSLFKDKQHGYFKNHLSTSYRSKAGHFVLRLVTVEATIRSVSNLAQINVI